MQIGPMLGRFALAVAIALVAASAGWGQVTDGSARRIALLAAIEGPIGPATVRHVEKVIETADERDAEVLILRLDTPGGLVDSMREIIVAILASRTPVVGFVAPPGAHAASAGTYILYATHVAAMAPGTNLGAATPVQIGGLPGLPAPEDEKPAADKDSDAPGSGATGPERDGSEPEKATPPPLADAMSAKATNDAVAFIRSLAEMRGRNADWAEQAVREAASLSATQARARNVIDLVADDPEALLAAIDGRRVEAGGVERTLATAGLEIEPIEVDAMTRVLSVLSNPNVAFLLMIIGVYGLIFEFSNPGIFAPGRYRRDLPGARALRAEPAAARLRRTGVGHARDRVHGGRGVHPQLRRARPRRPGGLHHRRRDADRHRSAGLSHLLVGHRRRGGIQRRLPHPAARLRMACAAAPARQRRGAAVRRRGAGCSTGQMGRDMSGQRESAGAPGASGI